MRARFILPAMMLAASFSVFAQSAAPRPAAPAGSPPTAAQQAAQARTNQQMVNAAVQVAQLIDAGKLGEVWDGASPIAKQAATRNAFIKQIAADRATLGALASRSLYSLTYSESDGKSMPVGRYANIAFASKFANAKQPARELVSFHLESDKTWRVAGYTLR